ncbi:MAG TPA: NB-ARC domain-containing protein [Actinomycetota bacterium]|nr:NB-ARC domain-containing protein [Actinomycetota bacterium]
MTRALPTGTVTFLFTDIEGSTRLLGQLGQERFSEVLQTHRELLRGAFGAGGIEFGTEGDALFVAFPVASEAVVAAVEGQRALGAYAWPADGTIRVRMGLHTGEGQLGAEGYVGLDVHRAARIAASGHGGQIVVSEQTRVLAEGAVTGDGVSFLDLGEHRLKDLPEPQRLFQVTAAGLDTDFPALKTADAARGNLPPQLTTFVGRRQEVDAVKEILRTRRLVTLTGPGGTGKTRLSLQAARELEGDFPGGAYFVALASIREPELVMPTVAQALGVREVPNEAPIQTLTNYLGDRRTLLVLDNFEQVLGAAADVGALLAGAPGTHVIVSSREPLQIQGEQEHPVPPLGLPDPRHLPPLDSLSQFESVALFIERARSVRPDFEVTNQNAPAVAEICARLDGLPLAIELAAARVKLLSPEAILSRLEHSLALLAGGARDLPARQQTLRGAIEWSYDLLDEDERRLFARLSVFAGGWSLEAADRICMDGLGFDPLDGVASLVNKSLVRQSARLEDRFFLLETIREFAGERLEESPDADEVHRGHAEHFLSIAEEAAPDLFGSKQAALLDALEADHDNLRTAITWSAQSGDLAVALRIAGALWRFWQMRGYLREGAERLDALVRHPDAERNPAALALALEAAGGVAYWMGRWDEATAAYERTVQLARELGNRSAEAEALYNLSFTFAVPPAPRRDLARARELIEQALVIYRENDDRRGEAKALWGIAANAEAGNDWERSLGTATDALPLFLELDDRFGAAWSYHSIGLASSQLGKLDEATAALTEGMEIFLSAGDVTGVGLLLADFALLEATRGDHPRAARLRGASLEMERLSGQELISNVAGYIDNLEDVVRGSLSEDEYAGLQREGAAMSMEEAAAYALGRDVPAAPLSD